MTDIVCFCHSNGYLSLAVTFYQLLEMERLFVYYHYTYSALISTVLADPLPSGIVCFVILLLSAFHVSR
jgi:hypothetical protein